jgi:hypothetical protein
LTIARHHEWTQQIERIRADFGIDEVAEAATSPSEISGDERPERATGREASA